MASLSFFCSLSRIVDPELAITMLHKTRETPRNFDDRMQPPVNHMRGPPMGGPPMGGPPMGGPPMGGPPMGGPPMGGPPMGGFDPMRGPPGGGMMDRPPQGPPPGAFGGRGEGPPPFRDGPPVDRRPPHGDDRFGGGARRDPRARDPRDPRAGRGPPPSQGPPPQRGGGGPPMGGGGGGGGALPPHLANADPEKAELIMQVLKLTDEQIALLPDEQKRSILELKRQINQGN